MTDSPHMALILPNYWLKIGQGSPVIAGSVGNNECSTLHWSSSTQGTLQGRRCLGPWLWSASFLYATGSSWFCSGNYIRPTQQIHPEWRRPSGLAQDNHLPVFQKGESRRCCKLLPCGLTFFVNLAHLAWENEQLGKNKITEINDVKKRSTVFRQNND